MKKFIILKLTLFSSTLFSIPNMAEHVDGQTFNGLFTGYYQSNECHMEYTEMDGRKVAVGYEPASKTMVVIGRKYDGFFCRLIDKNGKINEAVIEDWQEGYFRLKFPFHEGFSIGEPSTRKTICSVYGLESQTPTFFIITETLELVEFGPEENYE